MDITWIGSSCFSLQSGPLLILTDPFDLPGSASDLAALLDSPDIVTVSRRAARDRLQVNGAYRVVDGPGEYEIKGVPVTGIATAAGGPPAPQEGEPRVAAERNVVYTISFGGVSVCHLGRLDRPLSAQQLQEIGSPDVLLLPLGEGTGLPVARAVELANQLESRILIPMTFDGPGDEAAVERFCREFGADAANFVPRLTVTSSGSSSQVQVARLAPARPPGQGHGAAGAGPA